jgi:hypothetical protein
MRLLCALCGHGYCYQRVLDASLIFAAVRMRLLCTLVVQIFLLKVERFAAVFIFGHLLCSSVARRLLVKSAGPRGPTGATGATGMQLIVILNNAIQGFQRDPAIFTSSSQSKPQAHLPLFDVTLNTSSSRNTIACALFIFVYCSSAQVAFQVHKRQRECAA